MFWNCIKVELYKICSYLLSCTQRMSVKFIHIVTHSFGSFISLLMKCACLDAQVPKFWRRIAWSQHVLGANPAGLLHQISGSPCRAGSAGCKPLHRWEGAPSAGSLGRVKRQQLGAACQKCQGSESQPGKGKGKKQKPRDSSRHWEKGKEKSQNCKCSGARREVRALWATLEEGD